MEDPGGRTCTYNHISAFMIMATICMYVATYGSHVCMYVCMYVYVCSYMYYHSQERVLGFHVLSPNAGEIMQGYGVASYEIGRQENKF